MFCIVLFMHTLGLLPGTSVKNELVQPADLCTYSYLYMISKLHNLYTEWMVPAQVDAKVYDITSMHTAFRQIFTPESSPRNKGYYQ